jgi:hypothetical protein
MFKVLIIAASICLSVLFSSCANPSSGRIRGAKMSPYANLKSIDYTVSADEPGKHFPSLIRVQKSGLCVFSVFSEGPLEVEAAPGEQIPEGDSDFYGMVLSSDFKNQTARVRSFDLGQPL